MERDVLKKATAWLGIGFVAFCVVLSFCTSAMGRSQEKIQPQPAYRGTYATFNPLEVPSPKTRQAPPATAAQSNKRVGLLVAVGVLVVGIAAISGWYFGLFQNFGKTRNVVTTQPSVTEPEASPKISALIETSAPPISPPVPAASVPERPAVPAGPKSSQTLSTKALST